jgi:hypothetical protein
VNPSRISAPDSEAASTRNLSSTVRRGQYDTDRRRTETQPARLQPHLHPRALERTTHGSADRRSTRVARAGIMLTYSVVCRRPLRAAERDRMTDDIELPTTKTLDSASSRKTRSPEEAMRVTILKSIAVSVPLAIAIFIGMVALALRNQNPNWKAYLAMAAGIGVIAGVFFGLLMGFTLTSHNFE